jgi:MscS family membrane protein
LFTDVVARLDSFTDNGFRITLAYFIVEMDNAKFMAIKEEVNFKIIEIVQKQGAAFARQGTVLEMEKTKPLTPKGGT